VLLREVIPIHSSNPKVSYLNIALVDLFTANRDFLFSASTPFNIYFCQTTLLKMVRMLDYHQNIKEMAHLLQKEAQLVVFIWGKYKGDMSRIGREIIRLLPMVYKIQTLEPIFSDLKEMMGDQTLMMQI
jgi:hypothetical protein